MNYRKRFLWILCAVALAGCEPYEFTMSRDIPIDGLILTPLETVTPGSTTAIIRDGGAIKLTNFGISEYSLSFGLHLKKGTGVEVLIHPRVEVNRIVDSGIVARLTTTGEELREGDRRMAAHDEYRIDSTVKAVNILSEGHYLQVVVGCDTLFRGRSEHIESDDIVIRTLPASEVEIVAPAWRYVPDLVR